MGACQATPCNLGPTRRPAGRRYSRHVARPRRMTGRPGTVAVTYYSVDPGRVQHNGRNNDADRDVTVIPVIPGRWPRVPARLGHQFQLHTEAPSLVGPLSSSRVTSSSCARPFLSVAGVSRGVRRHQFQLRTVVPSGLQGPFGRGRSHEFPPCRRSSSRVRLRAGHQVQLRITRLLPEPPDGPEGLSASRPLRVVR